MSTGAEGPGRYSDETAESLGLLEAVETLEGEQVSQEEEIRALQALVNSGTWGLQGTYGRAMMGAIEDGLVALGPEPAHDYYGNRIPARHEVEAGTKGSVEFVEEHSPFGRILEDELCPTCGQPDNCGDCNHAGTLRHEEEMP